MYKFKVCPVQGRQLLDVRKSDLFGDFRICDTYRGGGGYDQLPAIIERRDILSVEDGMFSNTAKQFVVQLYGCHLRCPYCYVTKDGIFGNYIEYSAEDIVQEFMRAREAHNVGVFHLMGGAPGLCIDEWYSIVLQLPSDVVFTSDILLTEKPYDLAKLKALRILGGKRSIYAVNIKGITDKNYKDNTGREPDWAVFWINLEKIMNSYINFYLTFTNPDLYYMEYFTTKLKRLFGDNIMNDSFIIEIKQYEAIKDGSAWS
jgi:uncharacterized Fe-S cluster-containing radical SAM superfamily protein